MKMKKKRTHLAGNMLCMKETLTQI